MFKAKVVKTLIFFHLSLFLDWSQALRKVTKETSTIQVNHVIEDGYEHPDVHFEGFVLSDVFIHHAIPSSEQSEKMTHSLTQRKLQFNQNRHLRTTINSTDGYALFENMTEEISSLDASPDLSRSKVRALAKLVFFNEQWEGVPSVWFQEEIMSQLDDPENELYFNAGSFEEMQNVTTALWKAARREIENVTESIGASIRLYDTPQSNITRLEIGLACLLFTRESDSILVFRNTISSGENTNFIAYSTGVIDTDAPLGATKLLKRNWERAGLEWGEDQMSRAAEPDWYLRAVYPTFVKVLFQRGFGEDIVAAVDGQQIGGDGDEIAITEKEATQQGFWPVAKAVIDQVREDLQTNGRILFSGYSQGGGFAEMARMYTEKKYNETWPVITFGSTGAACFPRDLLGFGRTNYLDDMDPTKYYENVTNYNNFFDPYGAVLGQNIGDTCFLGKYDIDNDLDSSVQYKYCKEVAGYSMVRMIADENLGFEPLRTEFQLCRFLSHHHYFMMKELSRDVELNSDGTTYGGCFQYEGAALDSGQCPVESDGLLDTAATTIKFFPGVLIILARMLF